MMIRYYLSLLILILTMTCFASPSVAILSTQNDSRFLANTISKKLSPVLSSDVYTIKNTYDISKVLSRKPSAVLLLSDESTRTYLKYRPHETTSVPIVSICTFDSYKEFSGKMDNALFICGITSSQELIEHLARFTGNSSSAVGYLYPDSLKEEAFLEMYRLQQGDVEVFAQRIQDKPTESSLLSSLKKLQEKGATIIRLLGNGESVHIIENEQTLREHLAKHASVVISDKKDLHHSLTGSVVVTLRENRELLGAVTAVLLAAVERTKMTPVDFTIDSDVASLHYGKVKHYSLMEMRPVLLEQLDSTLLSIDTISSRSEIWTELYTTLMKTGDTVMTVPSYQMELLEESVHFLDRMVLHFFTIKDVILTSIAALLLIVLLIISHKRIIKIREKQPKALLYPKKVLKRVISNPNGRNKNVTAYLKKEQFRSVPVKSLIKYKREFKADCKRLHIIDWERGSEAVQFLRNMLRDMKTMESDIVVIFNIPRKRQLEVTPRFGEALLHLYEKFPTTEDLDRVLYGSGKQEQNVSYISGVITDDSLPPIFQMLETNNVTGALLIEDPNPFAAVFYRKGVIVYAEDRLGAVGEKSLYNVLAKKDGTFRFESDRKSPVENSSIRSMDLLMRWAASMDELSR